MDKNKNIILQQIANHLIINSSFLTDLSLYHGKMGSVLFFCNYARYTGNSVYEEFAGELLDELFSEIHDGIGVDFENGLSGIGWGILYLLKNNFIVGSPDDILEDIDAKMLEVNLLRVRDLSLERGIAGIVTYLTNRLSVQYEKSCFYADFISDLQKLVVDERLNIGFDLCSFVSLCTYSSIKGITRKSFGLYEGYAGYGFKLMAE